MAIGGKGFIAELFTSSGSWTCPAGVTQVFLIGVGGGAGGSSQRLTGGNIWNRGGMSSIPSMRSYTVTPNSVYTITIGAGGTGGTTGTPLGTGGGNTTFGSLSFQGAPPNAAYDTTFTWNGGFGLSCADLLNIRQANPNARGPFGNNGDQGDNNGGYGGASGYTGPGGKGGDALGLDSNGGAGYDADPTNYGAGGGGGGFNSSAVAQDGGDGAPGALWVIYIDGPYKLRIREYNTSGSWVAPAGITSAIVLAKGGGGGGQAGWRVTTTLTRPGGTSGLANYFVPSVLEVTPGTSYSITIGSGGSGGAGSASGNGGNSGSAGNNTTFGAIKTWYGAPGGGSDTSSKKTWGGYTLGPTTQMSGIINGPNAILGKGAGNSVIDNQLSNMGPLGIVGTAGTDGGASGGGAGAIGNSSDTQNGGNGGNGATSGSGGAGGNASSGGGGGGGGGGSNASSSSGAGGSGGSGTLTVLWAE